MNAIDLTTILLVVNYGLGWSVFLLLLIDEMKQYRGLLSQPSGTGNSREIRIKLRERFVETGDWALFVLLFVLGLVGFVLFLLGSAIVAGLRSCRNLLRAIYRAWRY